MASCILKMCTMVDLYCHSNNYKANLFKFLQIRNIVQSLPQNLDEPKASSLKQMTDRSRYAKEGDCQLTVYQGLIEPLPDGSEPVR